MEQQVHNRVVARQEGDECEEEVEASALLDGFVERNAQIDLAEGREAESARKIESEVTSSRRFHNERGQPARDIGKKLAQKREKIDSEYGDEIQSLVDLADTSSTDSVERTVSQVAQELFPQGEKDITEGRVAALLSWCYRVIKKLVSSRVLLTVVGVGAIAITAVILYKVLIKIDFFKWLIKKGGWAMFDVATEAVDTVRNSVPQSWSDYFRNGVGTAMSLLSGTTGAHARSSAARPRLLVVLRFVPRPAALLVIPLAFVGVGVGYFWWKKKSD